MSEETEEVVEGIDLDALAKQYEERGFFKRFCDMCSGLGKPHNTREYKLARIEMQRLMAPILAVLFVGVMLAAIIVMTAVAGNTKSKIEVTVAQIENTETEIEETAEEEPPDEPPPEPPPMEDVDVQVTNDLAPSPMSALTPAPTPPSQQVSVKPATQESVAIINSPVKMKSMVGSRTPGSIGAATRGGANYGDAQTEAAVYKALRWLKKTQNEKGCWQGTGNGARSSAAATGLAVLTYLAHGETPKSKEFGPTVQKAIEWLVNSQQEVNRNGEKVWSCADAGSAEYGFLIATYALCEAYGMTKNPNVKEAARRALERIVSHQSPTGGWNYYLCRDAKVTAHGKPDDLSFGGWCIQAIKAGKLAGIHVDGMEECIKKAINCLKTRNYSKEEGFSYRPDQRDQCGLAGVGCLAMQLLGYGSDPAVKNALNVMRDWFPTFEVNAHPHPTNRSWNSPQYYYYYASQCKFQAGMAKNAAQGDVAAWQKWNAAMKAYYPGQMKDAGEIPGPDGKPRKCGYWENKDTPSHTVRPVMDTCLVALQLMVYYRYLPQATLKAAEDKSAGASAATDKSNDVDVSVDI